MKDTNVPYLNMRKKYKADKTGSFYLLGSGSGSGNFSEGPEYDEKYQQYSINH